MFLYSAKISPTQGPACCRICSKSTPGISAKITIIIRYTKKKKHTHKAVFFFYKGRLVFDINGFAKKYLNKRDLKEQLFVLIVVFGKQKKRTMLGWLLSHKL